MEKKTGKVGPKRRDCTKRNPKSPTSEGKSQKKGSDPSAERIKIKLLAETPPSAVCFGPVLQKTDLKVRPSKDPDKDPACQSGIARKGAIR